MKLPIMESKRQQNNIKKSTSITYDQSSMPNQFFLKINEKIKRATDKKVNLTKIAFHQKLSGVLSFLMMIKIE